MGQLSPPAPIPPHDRQPARERVPVPDEFRHRPADAGLRNIPPTRTMAMAAGAEGDRSSGAPLFGDRSLFLARGD